MAVGANYSDQEANKRAVPPVMNTSNTAGKLHRAFFSGTVAGANLDIGSTIDLVALPVGARILGGKWYNGANFGVAATTIDIGWTGAAAALASAVAVAAAANVTPLPEAVTEEATGLGIVTTATTNVIRVTTGGGVIVVNGTYKGFIDYVLE